MDLHEAVPYSGTSNIWSLESNALSEHHRTRVLPRKCHDHLQFLVRKSTRTYNLFTGTFVGCGRGSATAFREEICVKGVTGRIRLVIDIVTEFGRCRSILSALAAVAVPSNTKTTRSVVEQTWRELWTNSGTYKSSLRYGIPDGHFASHGTGSTQQPTSFAMLDACWQLSESAV
jgi:hypothetical protein